ncbi:MAG: hypothetical protein KUL78_00570 [Flavobacterium sp.]|nr:hypothetical protein [Flavobacterium sp.]
MKKLIYFALLFLSFAGIVLFSYARINIGISLKYEVEPGECISNVSGNNLCKQQEYFLYLTILCLVVFLVVIYFQRNTKSKEKSA